MKRIQQGFTLIELVVVITILGILAATALPRFVGLQRDARIAKLQAARGAVLAASGMVYGAALARTSAPTQPTCAGGGVGANPPAVNAVGLGNVCTQSGRLSVINWNPTANLGGIIAASGIGNSAALPPVTQDLTNEGFAVSGGGTAIGSILTISVTGGPTPATCSFTYIPSSGGVAGTSAAISVVNTLGC